MPHKDSGTCRPGDIALIEVDIGIMTHEGIEPCTLVDAGILNRPGFNAHCGYLCAADWSAPRAA